MNFNIKIGDIVINIQHTYDYIKNLCNDYITEETPLVYVFTTDELINEEYNLTNKCFPLAVCESTCLHREVTKQLIKYGYLLIHSAVVSVDNHAYVFMAKSGVGKSTHISLWRQLFKKNLIIVNGDKPMFSFKDNTLFVHGTPWKGKENYGQKISVPVAGMCFLERDTINSIERATSKQVVDKIFHQVLVPSTLDDLTNFMNLLNKIIKTTPFYILKCNMEINAAEVAYQKMKEGIKNEN